MSKLVAHALHDYADPKLDTLSEAKLHLYLKQVEDAYAFTLSDEDSPYAVLAQGVMANQIVLGYAYWVLLYPQHRALFTRRAEALLGIEVDLTLPAPTPPPPGSWAEAQQAWEKVHGKRRPWNAR